MVALEDDNVSVIGVYGMGGVGKTTLVKEVAQKAKEKQLFDEVVLVAITQTPNMMNTQNEIAEKLGLKIEETTKDVRAARLHERLKKEQKVLIVLDDIWVTLDLEAIGIPSGDQHKGCKILMTSRRLDVLESMGSQLNIPIYILKEYEAWNLFKNMAGRIVERSDLQSIAVEVAKRCAGLPIAIATIAKALQHKKNLFTWRDALRQLRNPCETNFKGIPAEAYKAIELSYKFIEAEELGPIFLLCSIMGHNAANEDLLKYAMALGFIHDVNTMEETRDKVSTLVSDLKASSLLLDGSDPTCSFDMHDVVRDVALLIASRDQHWLALGSDDVFKGWPDEERMKNCRLISLQNAKVRDDDLNHELECPNLTFLSMHCSKDSCVEIPNNFFKGMQRLKVLDIAEAHFASSSIGSLKTLTTLRLIGCDVKDVAILGELKILEILDLRGSEISMLPNEIGELSKLKLLDLSGCRKRIVISPNVLSRLSSLEELYLYGQFACFDRSPSRLHSFDSCDRMVIEEINDSESSNAILVELLHLSHLTTLELHIPDVSAIPKDTSLFFEKLERYKISIGRKWDYVDFIGIETSRMLKLSMRNESIDLVDGIKQLLRKVESLVLYAAKDVGEMLCDSITQGFPHLKYLCVRDLSDIKVVINSMMEVSRLESLKLYYLSNLEAIWEDGQLNAESFDQMVSSPSMKELELDSPNEIEKIRDDNQLPPPIKVSSFGVQSLTSLRVSVCPKLKYVLSSCMAKSFVQLKTLDVSSCHEMEEVIEGILEGGEKQVFPKLDSLMLNQLLKLKRFCSGINRIEFPSLMRLFIWSCAALKTFYWDIVGNNSSHDYLFNQKVFFPAIKELDLRELDFWGVSGIERIWHDDILWVTNLTSLELWNCNKFKYVFSSCLVKNFVHLKELEIISCFNMEEVIEEGILEGEKQVFPKLDSLELHSLYKLKRFCSGSNLIEFPSLRKLKMKMCPVLKTFHCDTTNVVGNNISHDHFFNQKVILPVLKELDVEDMCNLEGLWPIQLAEQFSFSNLTSFSLSNCHKLVDVFPLSMVTRLQGLKTLQGEGGSSSSAIQSEVIQSSVSFCNLVTLIVYKCDGIRRLITHPTVKTLVQLKEMKIIECANIEEIIEVGDDDEIKFPQLNTLTLEDLPKLKSFCSSGNYTLGFPFLEILVVKECPKMEMFSQQDSDTPMLHQVKESEFYDEGRWEGSLNSTIQQLFKKKSAVADESENSEQDQTNTSTANTQNYMIEELEISEEGKSIPSTSEDQNINILEEGEQNSIEEDEASSSTSNAQ